MNSNFTRIFIISLSLAGAAACGAYSSMPGEPDMDGGGGDFEADDALQLVGPCHTVALESGKSVCLPQKKIYDSARAPAPIKSAFPESLPLKVDALAYLNKTCPTVHDQGKCGWTVPHSVTVAMEAEYCRVNGAEVLLSPPHLWYAGAKKVQDCSGEWDLLTAVKTASANYLVASTVWPYDEDASKMAGTRPSDTTLLGKGQQQIKSYHSVEPASVVNLKTAVSKGYNVIYVVPVFQGMGWSKPCSGQTWSKGDVSWKKPGPGEPRCTPSSKVCKKPDYSDDLKRCRCESSADCPRGLSCVAGRCADGWQAVLVIGYDNAKGGWFKFKNSWSNGWGDKGYGRLSYDMVRAAGQGGLFPSGLNLKTVCKKQVCTPGTTRCDAAGKNTLRCRKDGCGWDAHQACQCQCSGGKCQTKTCTPFSNKCNGNNLQQCGAAGCMWTNSKYCECGCAGGACKKKVCTPLAKQCLGNTLQQCNATGCGWVTIKKCGTCGCSGMSCKTRYYADKDGDGYGDSSSIGQCLNGPTGVYKVQNNKDCNDNDKDVHPAAKDRWDVRDNNCDGKVDEQGLTVSHLWHRAHSSTDWEHRYASTSPGPGWTKEPGWMQIYPTTICANSTYSSKTCYTLGKQLQHKNSHHNYLEAVVRKNVVLDALAACTGAFGPSGSGPRVTFYLLMKDAEYWDYKNNYNNKAKFFSCTHVGYVMNSAIAALASSARPFYRLESSSRYDEMWSPSKAPSGHASYSPYFSYVHWYAPHGK